jgi:hypothetical protein
MANLILTRGARRVVFAPDSASLVILRGEIGRKNFWLLNPQTGAERQLTDLPSKFELDDFDISADGKEIIFNRAQDRFQLGAFLTRTLVNSVVNSTLDELINGRGM